MIPADVATAEKLSPHDPVRVHVFTVRHPEPGPFTSLKDLHIDAQGLKDELRQVHDL